MYDTGYAVGIECNALIVMTYNFDFSTYLWQYGYTFGRGVGYGVAIMNEVSTPNGVASVLIDNTYHLLGTDAGGDENEL